MTPSEEILVRYRHEIYEASYTLLILKYAKRNKLFAEDKIKILAVNFYEHNYCSSILKPMVELHCNVDIDSIIDAEHEKAYKNYKKWLKERR